MIVQLAKTIACCALFLLIAIGLQALMIGLQGITPFQFDNYSTFQYFCQFLYLLIPVCLGIIASD